MILYMLAPRAELLFEGFDPDPDHDHDPVSPPVTCQVEGGYLQGVMTAQGMRITRLDSTDPRMYLRRENDVGALFHPSNSQNFQQTQPKQHLWDTLPFSEG